MDGYWMKAKEYTFARTVVPVQLALYEGESLVSRSQAKLLSMRFERVRSQVASPQPVPRP